MDRLKRYVQGSRRIAPVAILTFVAACAPASTPSIDDPGEVGGGTERAAAELVRTWLHELAGAAPDRGWSLLFSYVQTDVIRSEAAYRQAVEGINWAEFRGSIVSSRLQDGEHHVEVRVDGGAEQVPKFMLEWGLIYFPAHDGVRTETGIVTVRIDPSGSPVGIQAAP